MPKYVVIRPIKGLVRAGETLQPGQIISIEEDRARRSLETGHLEPCEQEPEKKAKGRT